MKKIFKLASAEFSKIFYRPSIFILTALLIATLVLSNLMYKPVGSIDKLSYSASSVSNLYSQFTSSTTSGTTINKLSIDNELLTAKQKVVNDFESINNIDILTDFNSKIEVTYNYLIGDFKSQIMTMQTSTYSVSQVQATFRALSSKTSALLNYMASNIKGKTINFYFKTKDYETIYSYALKFFDSIPTTFEEYNKNNYLERANYLFSNFDFTPVFEITNKLNKIELSADDYTSIISLYYTEATEKLNSEYFNAIEEYYTEHIDSNEEEHINELNELCAQYYSFATSNTIILNNSIELMRIGNKSDTELKDLVGYTQSSKYQLTEQITINKYLIETQTNNYDYLTSFNYNTKSGNETNAFDYTFYAMQILSILIIVFCIFYSCSSIAGDQANGTMKMISIRPISRNKLFSGKFLSCFNFGLLLLAISFVASFVVGVASFGLTAQNCLVAWNSITIVEVNPYLLLISYFISCAVNILFFISVAMFICMIFKNNTLSVFISSLIYGLSILLNGLSSSILLKLTPFGHLDLFKYFGNSKAGFFSFNLLPDSNFVVSAFFIGFAIIIMNTISHLIFKRRSIA